MKRYLYSGLGLGALLLLFLAFNVASHELLVGARLDLTENKQYTLSEGTRRILGRLQEPVDLYFYYSADTVEDIPQIRNYAQQVGDLLQEYALRADGKLRVHTVNPQPFSEAEDRARLQGVQPVQLGGEKVYFGLAALGADTKQVIGFLQPQRAPLLEYDLSKLLYNLQNSQRPVVGVLTNLPIGGFWSAAMGGAVPPWQVYRDASQLFEIKDFKAPVERIDDDVEVLWVVHPKEWDVQTRYAIDQFIMRGGQAVIFVDPFAESEPVPPGHHPLQARPLPHFSDLPESFAAWGVEYAPDQVLLDKAHALPVRGPQDIRPVPHPGILGLGKTSINEEDIASAQLNQINLGYAGALAWRAKEGVEVTPLLTSSEQGRLAAASVVQNTYTATDLAAPASAGEGAVRTVAARISGRLPSGFATAPEDIDDAGHLAQSVEPVSVIVVADVDLLGDDYWLQKSEYAQQILVQPFADNGDLVTNALDNLTGSEDLIAIRSRGAYTRPFERVQALRAQAESQFRGKEQELEAKLADTEAQLSDLQRSRGGKPVTLTPEQEAALEAFVQEKRRIRAELREVRYQLDRDIQALGTRLKLANIGLMPLVVAGFGVAVAAARLRRRRQARTAQRE
jgi:ABC-type uncharacterized transport system involved in gliding motility auxiliary subunit